MWPKRFALLTVLSILTADSRLLAEDGPTPVNVARKAAKKDAATPEGRDWEHRHAPWMGPTLAPLMGQCGKEAPGVNQEFSAYVHITKPGKALEAVAEPANPFTSCMTKRLKAVEYPAVPREHYWLEIEMHIQK